MLEHVKILRMLVAILLLSLAGVGCAQEYSFRVWGNSDGLNNLSVSSIYQDREGFLWVGTENGVYRFSGDRFEEFGTSAGMPVNAATSFGEAPDGTLLVGGSYGLYRLRGSRFEPLMGGFKSVSGRQGIAKDAQGHTYLATERGLVLLQFDDQKQLIFREITTPIEAGEIAAYSVYEQGGKVWFGCGLALCQLSVNHDTTAVIAKVVAVKGLPRARLTHLSLDRDGVFWAWASKFGLFYRSKDGSPFQRSQQEISTKTLINPQSLDAQGQVLLPTGDGLLIRKNGRWRKVGRNQGLRGGLYYAFEDRQHSLWIGTSGRGLMQWRGYGIWENYTRDSGLPNESIWEMSFAPDGSMWMGSGGGLLRAQRHDDHMQFENVRGLGGNSIRGLLTLPNGDLMMGSESRGIARYSPKSGRVQWYGEQQGLKAEDVYVLKMDAANQLWAATDRGVYHSQSPYESFDRAAQLPASVFYTVAIGDDGKVWAGGDDGLFVLERGQWRGFSKSSGLSNTEVLSLGVDLKGAVWVGYEYGKGLDRVRLEDGGLRVDKGLQRRGTDGMIYFLSKDAKGNLWAGTEHGVDRWDGRHWSHFDSNDGLVWNDCDLNSFAAEADGTVWIGTSGGLSRFHPPEKVEAAEPLRVVFTKLWMGNNDVTGEQTKEFALQANSLRAGFTALGTAQSKSLLFRYMLVQSDAQKGSSEEWTETTQREVQFAGLAAGHYRLRIEAENCDGLWNTKGAEVAFRVLPLWYRTWWFESMLAFLPMLVIFLLVRWRITLLEQERQDFLQLKAAHDEIRNLALFDPMTALPNRRMLVDRVDAMLSECEEEAGTYALFLIDLDHFKVLNDSLGHVIGDRLLHEIAHRLTSVQQAEFVARLGGDEFVLVMKPLTGEQRHVASSFEDMAQQVMKVIAEPVRVDDRELICLSSIGITIFAPCSDESKDLSASELIKQADLAVYQAKDAGRNTVRFFAPSLQATVNARAEIERELRLGIKLNQLTLHYQPLLGGRGVIGAEALVRWMHPEKGLLYPGAFIELAEESGLILPLGSWVLNAACRQLAEWQRAEQTAHLDLSVNISALQFHQPDFVENVLKALKETGADPRHLDLEVTESILVENIEAVIEKMKALRAIGVRFSLDDFGTGYSSLSYLKQMPLDRLKIDASFVRDLIVDEASRAIAQSVVMLGQAMRLAVVAEGVEQEEQRACLEEMGCLSYQGYLFSKPVSIEQFTKFCLENSSETPRPN